MGESIVVSVNALCTAVGMAALSQSLSTANAAAAAAVSMATWSRNGKPAPLVLSSSTAADEAKTAPVGPTPGGSHDDSSVPTTPITDPVIPRRQPTAFEVTTPAD